MIEIDSESYSKLIKLAIRSLHIAHVWNDHNFKGAHLMALDTSIKIGIKNFDEANDFLSLLPSAFLADRTHTGEK